MIVPAAIGEIPNLHLMGGVYTSGQPQAADLTALRLAGVRTVINLRHDREHSDFKERELVEAVGLEYVELPWNGADELTDEIFEEGRRLFENAPQPMLMHCGSANRVGALWLAWRALDGGLDLELATQEAREIGLRTKAYETRAREYVRLAR